MLIKILEIGDMKICRQRHYGMMNIKLKIKSQNQMKLDIRCLIHHAQV